MKFCQADFSMESLNFYLHVQDINSCPLSQIKQKVQDIYRWVEENDGEETSRHSSLDLNREHLAPNAPQEVNINDTIRTRIIKQLDNPTR